MRPTILAGLILLAACSPKPDAPPQRSECSADMLDLRGACSVSMVQLIARPEAFDGMRVSVVGFVNFEFEGNGLYISAEDWRQSISRNGVWIDFSPATAADSVRAQSVTNRHYVMATGVFSAKDRGHLGMWSGTLRATSMIRWGVTPGAKVQSAPLNP